MHSNAHWPHDLADAISAKIVRWDAGGLRVIHVFPAPGFRFLTVRALRPAREGHILRSQCHGMR
jgi:hypothetical protein